MEKNWRYLIVIDPSPNCSGYAVFDVDNKPKLITYGHIHNRHFETKEFGKKLIHIEMMLNTLRQNFYPHVIVKEEHVNSPGTGYKTAMPHGIIEKLFTYTPIHEINNSTFKFEFVGHGKASKTEVEEEVMKYKTRIWGRKPLLFRTDDESDAVAIGVYWLITNGFLQKL